MIEFESLPEVREARAADWDASAYRKRNIIERLVGWLKKSRCIFSRFEKTAKTYAQMMTIAFIQRYLRLLDV
jgi:transposase